MAEPSLSITMVFFSLINEQLNIMLDIKQNKWSLPEEHVNTELDHSLEQTVKRVFKQRMGKDTPYLEQVETLGNKHRIPHSWSVTINYYCLVSQSDTPENWASDKAKWIPYADLNEADIAFDHRDVIESCLQRFQNKSLYTSLPIFLLPQEFTLTELQKTYEIVLGFKIEKKSFRRRLLDAGFLEETGNIRRASHRPALLYRLAHPQPYFFPRIIEGVRENRHHD